MPPPPPAAVILIEPELAFTQLGFIRIGVFKVMIGGCKILTTVDAEQSVASETVTV